MELQEKRVLSRRLVRGTSVGDVYLVVAEGPVPGDDRPHIFSMVMPVDMMYRWERFEVGRGDA